jgi:hypothetical protein
VNFRYTRDRDTVAEESLEKMSVAVENGVDASKTRGVFSRAFAKRAQPFEEGELFDVRCSSPDKLPPRGIIRRGAEAR